LNRNVTALGLASPFNDGWRKGNAPVGARVSCPLPTGGNR
jgi:hypothetical protein